MLPTQLFPGYFARAVVVYSSQATATAALCCGRVQCDGYSNERGALKLPVCRHENTHKKKEKKRMIAKKETSETGVTAGSVTHKGRFPLCDTSERFIVSFGAY